jgi:thymidylate synthase
MAYLENHALHVWRQQRCGGGDSGGSWHRRNQPSKRHRRGEAYQLISESGSRQWPSKLNENQHQWRRKSKISGISNVISYQRRKWPKENENGINQLSSIIMAYQPKMLSENGDNRRRLMLISRKRRQLSKK